MGPLVAFNIETIKKISRFAISGNSKACKGASGKTRAEIIDKIRKS